VSDDDGSLGVVDPGLECLGDNMDWGRCGIGNWSRGNVGNWGRGSVGNWGWSSNSYWYGSGSRSRDGCGKVVFNFDGSGNLDDWGWCGISNGSSNSDNWGWGRGGDRSGEVVFNLNWCRCGIGDWCWGSNNNWCRSWSRDGCREVVLDLDWCRQGNGSSNRDDWGWCWGRNGSGEVIFNFDWSGNSYWSSSNNNWGWCWGGNWCREVVFNLNWCRYGNSYWGRSWSRSRYWNGEVVSDLGLNGNLDGLRDGVGQGSWVRDWGSGGIGHGSDSMGTRDGRVDRCGRCGGNQKSDQNLSKGNQFVKLNQHFLKSVHQLLSYKDEEVVSYQRVHFRLETELRTCR
jgi:hypothetical protein